MRNCWEKEGEEEKQLLRFKRKKSSIFIHRCLLSTVGMEQKFIHQ
jgi:hypothetical protein